MIGTLAKSSSFMVLDGGNGVIDETPQLGNLSLCDKGNARILNGFQ